MILKSNRAFVMTENTFTSVTSHLFPVLNDLACRNSSFWRIFLLPLHVFSILVKTCLLLLCAYLDFGCVSLTFCLPDYPVLSFDGRKKVVLSNVSWMGGKNEFLGIAYLVIGSLCVLMSIVMLIVYAKFKFPEEDWVTAHWLWKASQPYSHISFLLSEMMKAMRSDRKDTVKVLKEVSGEA